MNPDPFSDSVDAGTQTEYSVPKRRKSIDKLESRKQILKRTNVLYQQTCDAAKSEGIELHRFFGILLHRYGVECHSSILSDIGNSLWNNEKKSTKRIPNDVSLAVYTECNLGRQTYTKRRLILKNSKFDVFPAWNSIRSLQKTLTPDIVSIPDPHRGVYFPLVPSIKITTEQINKSINLCPSKLPNDKQILMKIKIGFDGSGNHSVYHQKGNMDTNNFIMATFWPLELSLGKMLLWKEPSPNLPKSHRAIMIQLGKGSYESLQSLKLFDHDKKMLKEEGIIFD